MGNGGWVGEGLQVACRRGSAPGIAAHMSGEGLPGAPPSWCRAQAWCRPWRRRQWCASLPSPTWCRRSARKQGRGESASAGVQLHRTEGWNATPTATHLPDTLIPCPSHIPTLMVPDCATLRGGGGGLASFACSLRVCTCVAACTASATGAGVRRAACCCTAVPLRALLKPAICRAGARGPGQTGSGWAGLQANWQEVPCPLRLLWRLPSLRIGPQMIAPWQSAWLACAGGGGAGRG